MRKLYVVRLTKPERVELQSVVKKLTGTGQKVRRAQILLKADADGPNWTDDRALAQCIRAGFRRVVLRGDTDFTQTEHLDRWNTLGVSWSRVVSSERAYTLNSVSAKRGEVQSLHP